MVTEQIGRLAELIAATDLSRPVIGRYRRPLFRVNRLGEKYPTVDLLVDLLDRNDMPIGFFFAQVKGTLNKDRSPRLPIQVDRERYRRLLRLPLPTYLIGVDVRTEQSYVVAANRRARRLVDDIEGVLPANPVC